MSREDFLAGLPTDPDFNPCRCRQVDGYTKDIETGFWVCGNCRKPSGGNPRYSPWCLLCDARYTRDKNNMSDEICQSCNA